MRRITTLLMSMLLTAAVTGAAEGRPLRGTVIDIEQDCRQIPPEVTPAPATDVSKVLPLEVRVMVERADLKVAKDHMKTTKEAFSLIGVKLKVKYDKVVVPEEWAEAESTETWSDDPSGEDFFTFMREHYGGKRPRGVDLVYYMTRYWGGGMADCIGGVASPTTAFAFGSLDYALEGMVDVPTANEGVIAAHELGHLLGGHHHYSNCTEAQPFGALRGDTNPCTTMSPFAATASSTFGLLERSYIRHYIAEYAKG